MQYTFRDWLSDQLEWFIMLVAIISLVACFFGISAGLVLYADRANCRAQAEAMDVSWSWGVWQNCMIVVDGKNIPLSAYKVVKVAR